MGKDGQFRLTVRRYGRRTLDLDNIWIKPIADQLVRQGYLPDDRPGILSEIRIEQFKSQEEKTVVILESI